MSRKARKPRDYDFPDRTGLLSMDQRSVKSDGLFAPSIKKKVRINNLNN